MLSRVFSIAALLSGVTLLLIGTGLLNTLIALRGVIEGFSDQVLGLMGSGYFAGFFIGTYAVPGLVQRVGHVRASNFFSAAVAGLILLHVLVVEPWMWVLIRVLSGIVLVGFYTVIESWLHSQSSPEQRGQIFSVYMVVNMLSIAVAQQFLYLASAESFVLFAVAAMLVCFSVLPIAATRLPQPIIGNAPRLKLRQIWLAAPTSALGGVVCGLVMGAFWSLMPLYASRVGLNSSGVAVLVSVTIVGGALMQLPFGRLSDRIDRRLVLALVSGIAACAAALMSSVSVTMPVVLYGMAFLYGCAAFSIYPIVIAHLIDHLKQDDILSGNAGILLLYGIGAMIGPVVSGAAMDYWGASAFPIYFSAVLTPFTLYTLLQARGIKDEIIEAPAQFVPMVRTAETAMSMVAAVEEHHMDVLHSDAEDSADSTDVAAHGEALSSNDGGVEPHGDMTVQKTVV